MYKEIEYGVMIAGTKIQLNDRGNSPSHICFVMGNILASFFHALNDFAMLEYILPHLLPCNK